MICVVCKREITGALDALLSTRCQDCRSHKLTDGRAYPSPPRPSVISPHAIGRAA